MDSLDHKERQALRVLKEQLDPQELQAISARKDPKVTQELLGPDRKSVV